MAFNPLREYRLIAILVRFALIFGLLIYPYRGLDEGYASCFRFLGTIVFDRDGDARVVRFRAHEIQHGFSTLSTQMLVANRELVDSSGRGKALLVDLDTRSIGWIPTALTIALVLATPIPWRRSARALFWGLVLIHILILFSLQVAIWDQWAELSSHAASPLWQTIVDALYYTLITQMGASFAAPVVIWIAVTFRAGKERGLAASHKISLK